MVDLIAGIGGGLFVLASIVIGTRILVMGLRSRDLPELAIGCGLLLAAGLGYPMMMVAQLATGLPEGVRIGLLVAHMLCNIVGLGGLAYFTFRVFRPEAAWARVLWISLPATELLSAAAQLLGPGPMAFIERMSGPWNINTYVGMVVLCWAGFESMKHYSMARRRVRIGLAEPIVANRMGLWGVSMLSAATISILSVTLQAMGVIVMGSLTGALITGPLGLVTATAIYLAFMPPGWYVRRLAAAA